jgi:hypothetical protein
VYVSFYFVQLNVQTSQSPRVSFFPSDYTLYHSLQASNTFLKKETRRESKPANFRLNKRFHPEYLFTAPEALSDLVKYSFRIQTVLLDETHPLAYFSFNSPSFRGPPVIV